jgi:Flp pilus assembly pilin Flp
LADDFIMSVARLKTLLADDVAQGLVEYALILSLLAVAALLGLRLLGMRANNALTSAANKIGD